MPRKMIFLPLAIIISACGSLDKTQQVATKESTPLNLERPSRVQKDIVFEHFKSCKSCVRGSLGDNLLKASDRKLYYLFGAEHLKLENYYFDIPVVYNKATKKWIKYFTGKGKRHFVRYAERAGRYAPIMAKILEDQGLPVDLLYLSMAESGFANHARSWAKAVGPWQFMPYTGRRYGLEIDFFLDERRDPFKATVAAAQYLRELYDRFGTWELAMASYNAGEGKISRAIKRYRTKSFWKIRKGRYLRPETKNYVPKIMALAIIGKNLKSFGMNDEIEFQKPLDYQEVEVFPNTDLYKVANALDLTFDELKRFNPEVLRWQTPPGTDNYVLRLPVGKKAQWNEVKVTQSFNATDYKPYMLRGYATLKHVARKFRVPLKALTKINQHKPEKRLFPKTVVHLPFRVDHETHKKHDLYADLYEPPRKQVRRRQTYRKWIRRGRRKGNMIENPKEYYTVKKGDTLWEIAKRSGVSVNTLIRSNYGLVKRRMILPGDKLAIR